ncbi:hypothetical protein BT63DRAFT_449996 [Microthyrium microscopicum]|uniref:DNA recombination and repair protein Rad51-like C-terminal domain-containing protein n=1 Tax=Microthyrium microscopicum TaxID=703497 RepID=A0A6A6UU56_9PEZI|nr:hypothetical protein BT63DRAFT_449996 [Microthyrium microscopicum]
MSVQEAGRRLLGEVKSEDANEIFRIARFLNQTKNRRDVFGVPQLDVPAREGVTADDFLEYSVDDETLESGVDKLLVTSTGSTLIEITAADTCSGKSTLLYLIIAIGVLPRQHEDIEIGGKEGLVVVIDNDNKFDVLVLQNNMKSYIKRAAAQQAASEDNKEKRPEITTHTTLDDEVLNAITMVALSHVHIFRPASQQSLLATLDTLPTYLLGNKHRSSSRHLSSIVIDSASAFYWQLRGTQEDRKAEALDGNKEDTAKSMSSSYARLIKSLQSLSRRFECPVIATTLQVSAAAKFPYYDLNPTFPTAPNLQMTIARNQYRSATRYASDISVERARMTPKYTYTSHDFEVFGGNYFADALFSVREGVAQFHDESDLQKLDTYPT